MISFILLFFPIFYISNADSFSDLLIGGLFIGVSGAVFSAGVTSLPTILSKGTSWICERYLWNGEYRDRFDDLYRSGGCNKVWMGNNSTAICDSHIYRCTA